jgi:16S rRNA U516 pseudouridylate synthase RsuA-like enzyme
VNAQSDRITVDGALISVRLPEEVKWIAIHKPKGVVTTTKDEKVVWAQLARESAKSFLLFFLFNSIYIDMCV